MSSQLNSQFFLQQSPSLLKWILPCCFFLLYFWPEEAESSPVSAISETMECFINILTSNPAACTMYIQSRQSVSVVMSNIGSPVRSRPTYIICLLFGREIFLTCSVHTKYFPEIFSRVLEKTILSKLKARAVRDNYVSKKYDCKKHFVNSSSFGERYGSNTSSYTYISAFWPSLLHCIGSMFDWIVF